MDKDRVKSLLETNERFVRELTALVAMSPKTYREELVMRFGRTRLAWLMRAGNPTWFEVLEICEVFHVPLEAFTSRERTRLSEFEIAYCKLQYFLIQLPQDFRSEILRQFISMVAMAKHELTRGDDDALDTQARRLGA